MGQCDIVYAKHRKTERERQSDRETERERERYTHTDKDIVVGKVHEYYVC